MKKGSLMCMAAAVLFGLVPPLLNFLLRNGVSRSGGLIGPNTLLMIGTFIMCRLRGTGVAVSPSTALALMFVGMAGMGATNLLLGSAFAYLSVGMVTTIHFLYPTIVTLTEIAFLGKRATAGAFCASLLSLVGIACVSGAGAATGAGTAGFMLALASSFTYAFFIIGSERFKPASLHVDVGLFWMSGGAVLTALLYARIAPPLVLPGTPSLWCIYALFCVMIGCAFVLLSAGISSVGAVEAAFATLLEPLTAVVCGALFFGDPVTLLSVAGCAMVLASVYLNSRQ